MSQTGTATTARLGAGERAGVVNSYIAAFGNFPETIEQWQDVIKIGNGRWTKRKNTTREEEVKTKHFKKIYKRLAHFEKNQNDNVAVTIISYGLRQVNRNMDSEKAAIKTLRFVYQKDPTSATDWDIIRAVAYSGAKR